MVEMLVVMAIITLLFAIGVPAAKKLMTSFSSGANLQSVIGAALANARAIAAKDGTYAGVRFQENIDGDQYMILIKHDNDKKVTGYAEGFYAVANRKPTKLPQDVGVMDMVIHDATGFEVPIEVTGDDALSDENIDEDHELRDTSTFSIIFSKSGKLVIHNVRVRQRNSADDIFNNQILVGSGGAKFYQDAPVTPVNVGGLFQELSRKKFVIYNRREFDKVADTKRWSGQLKDAETLYVNPYSGRIISENQSQ